MFATGRWAVGIALCAAALVVLLGLTLLAGKRARRYSVVDVAWGLGFALVTLVSFGWSAGHGDTGQRVLVLVMTVAWGGRLGGYIGLRQRGAQEDPRYAKMLDKAQHKNPGTPRAALAFRKIYLLQGLLILAISMPVQVAMYEGSGPGTFAWAGLALWVVGLFFEGVGDLQMQRWRGNPANKGKIMDAGLWNYTRHPNYFGDACVWWGLFLVAVGHWPGILTLPAPIVMTFLLTKGSGKKTLEAHMGGRPGFEDYVNSTSGFFPLPPPVTRALHARTSSG